MKSGCFTWRIRAAASDILELQSFSVRQSTAIPEPTIFRQLGEPHRHEILQGKEL